MPTDFILQTDDSPVITVMAYITKSEDCIAALKQLDVQTRYGLDTETYATTKDGTAFDTTTAKMRLIQIGDTKKVFVFDVLKLSDKDMQGVYEFISKGKFYIHNALFDLRFLQAVGIPFVDCIDTMVLYSLYLKSEIFNSKQYSVSLKEAVRQIYNVDLDKAEQISDWKQPKLNDNQLFYSGYDALWVYKIGERLSKLPSSTTTSCALTMRVLNAIARIIRSGVYISKDKLGALVKEWNYKLNEAEELCDKYYDDINVRSNAQLGDWLQKHLPKNVLEVWERTPKGALKTDASTLSEYAEIEAIKPLLTYKKYSKYISTYGGSILESINPVTKRLHPQYTVAFTESGRLSSMQPNVQNFPRDAEYRALFVPQWDSTTLVCADYSQVEVRVAAILSKDKRMLEAYKTGKDLYKQTAALLLHKKEEDVTKAERQRAKAVVLGLQFGMGHEKLCAYAKNYGVQITEEESAALVNNYRKAYPQLYVWQKKTTAAAATSLTTSTMLGMVRKLSSDNYYTCSLNTPVQGSAAEAILYAIDLLDRELIHSKLPAKIVATVHDEILVECKKSVAEEVKDILTQCMILGFTGVFPETYGAENNIVEAHIGDSWAEAK